MDGECERGGGRGERKVRGVGGLAVTTPGLTEPRKDSTVFISEASCLAHCGNIWVTFTDFFFVKLLNLKTP